MTDKEVVYQEKELISQLYLTPERKISQDFQIRGLDSGIFKKKNSLRENKADGNSTLLPAPSVLHSESWFMKTWLS